MSRTSVKWLPPISFRTRLRNASHRVTRTLAKLVGLNLNFYRDAYFDVRPLSDGALLRHFLLTGRRESRIPSWSALLRAFRSAGIDPRSIEPIVYFSIHADLAPVGIDSIEAACVHFLRSGHREGRVARLDIPSFLDSVANPELVDKGWAVPRNGTALPSRREQLARAEFRDVLDDYLNTLDAEEFAATCFERYLGYLPELPHFDDLVAKLDVGAFSRAQWLVNLVSTIHDVREHGVEPRQIPIVESTYDDVASAANARHSEPIRVMGIPVMTTGEWHHRAFVDDGIRYTRRHSERDRPHGVSPSGSAEVVDSPRVSVLCSMYRTGELLVPFLESLRAQTLFSFTEFILVLVDPDDVERQTCSQFAAMFDNVVLVVSNERLGIYEAWNIGLSLARGKYVSNMNVDDVRQAESLEKQASLLDRFAWVDVVYQDVMVSLDSRLDWNDVARVGAKLSVSKAGLTTFASYRNPPHNAPMWRRSLHDELGTFDASLMSAGDFDFWFRCANAGKVFFNIADAHVGYFMNPDGLSTRKETRGYDEGRTIVARHRDTFVRGAKPPYVDDETRALQRPRSERATLGFVRSVHRAATPAAGGHR